MPAFRFDLISREERAEGWSLLFYPPAGVQPGGRLSLTEVPPDVAASFVVGQRYSIEISESAP